MPRFKLAAIITFSFAIGFACAIWAQPFLQEAALLDTGNNVISICEGGGFRLEAPASYRPVLIWSCTDKEAVGLTIRTQD